MGNFLSEFLLDVGIKALRASKAAEKLPRPKKKRRKRPKANRSVQKPPKEQSLQEIYGEDAVFAQGEDGETYVSVKLRFGYNEETGQYEFAGEKYEEGSIIWSDLAQSVNFCVNVFPDTTLLTPVSIRHLDTARPRLPLELDYVRVYCEATLRKVPTYAIVCRHGHFNVFVSDFYDDHGDPYYLAKIFNIMPCSMESPRLYAPLTAEIDCSDVLMFYVRYMEGRSIDWDKEIAKHHHDLEVQHDHAVELYEMGAGDDPDEDPHDFLADPPKFPPPPETEDAEDPE